MSKTLIAATAKPMILSLLAQGESYGYRILQDVTNLSGGTIGWSEALLYPVLHRLEKDGLIRSKWKMSEENRMRKYYSLTTLGRQELEIEKTHWFSIHEAFVRLWMPAESLEYPRRTVMFDLEKAIVSWRKGLAAHQALEPGYIAEIESHLRDKIDDLKSRGKAPEQAFDEAVRALGEALTLSILSMALAVCAAPLVLPTFNRLAGKALRLFGTDAAGLIVRLGLTAVVAGLLAGSYPAFLLSAFKPAQVLRRRMTATPGGAAFRKILIVLQFAASVTLILCSVVVARQLRFIRNYDLGFNRDQIVTVENNLQILPRLEAFQQELRGQAGILNVAAAGQRPLNVSQTIRVNQEGNPDPLPASIGYNMVDYDFFETFGMTIVKGRSLSRDYVADQTESCLINEAAAKMFGWDDPIGRTLYWSQGSLDPSLRNVRIVGVVNDFYDRSLRRGIRPFMFRVYRPWCSFIFIKVDKNRIPEALDRIQSSFKKFAPAHVFNFEFLDEAFNRLYVSESQQGRLFNTFALTSVIISGLGLFGLASFTAQRKTKEIGVRKVLGASVSSLVALMTKEYLAWIAAANLIAWPLGYYFMRQWLDRFAQRIPLNALYFPVASAAMLLVVLAAVGAQTLRAARANPADSLRCE